MSCYDSILPAQQETDLFNTIRHHQSPHAVPPRHLGRPESKDVLVSLQEKLEIEAQEKFRRGDYRFASDKLMIIGRIGKFMFLAVMLPSYLCLYGLPRWLLVEAIPKTYNLVQEFASRAAKIVADLALWLKEQAFIVLEMLKISKGESQRKAGEDSTGSEKKHHAFWRAFLVVPRGLIKGAYFLKGPLFKMGGFIKWVWLSCENILRGFFQKIERRINAGLKALAKALPRLLIYIGRAAYARLISPAIQALRDKALYHIEKIKKALMPAIEMVRKLFVGAATKANGAFQKAKKALAWTAKIVAPIIYPLVQQGIQAAKYVHQACEKCIKAISASFKYVGKAFYSYVSNLHQLLKKHTAPIFETIRKLPSIIDYYTPAWVKKFFDQCRKLAKKAAEATQNAAAGFSRQIVDPLQRQMSRLYAYIILILRFMLRAAKRALDLLIAGIKASPRQMYIISMKTFQLMRKGLSQIRYGCLVLLAWTKVFWGHGMELVRDVAEEVGQHIRIFNFRQK